MTTEARRVTDVTDVTENPYPPYTCTRARKNTYGKRVTSVTSVTLVGPCSFGGGQ